MRLFFYVLFCSYVLLSKQGTHPRLHNARDASSLARTKGPYLHELHNADEGTCNHHHKVPDLVKKDRKESNATSFPCVIIKNAPPTIVDFVH